MRYPISHKLLNRAHQRIRKPGRVRHRYRSIRIGPDSEQPKQAARLEDIPRRVENGPVQSDRSDRCDITRRKLDQDLGTAAQMIDRDIRRQHPTGPAASG